MASQTMSWADQSEQVEDVRVATYCRGRGVGSQLLAHAATQARDLGCNLIELFVHEDRDNAHRFYEQSGYTGVHRGYRKQLGSG